MALSGTDFAEYNNFQKQTEDYRYQMVQALNKMQIEHVKVGASLVEKDASISNQHWKNIPEFENHFLTVIQILKSEWLSILSLLVWTAGLLFVTNKSVKKLNAF